MGVEGFKEELEKGYEDERKKYPELFRNYRREPVTADTIKTEAEKPFKDTAQVLATASKLGIAYQTAVHGDYIRRRYQQFPFRGGDAPLVDVKATPINNKENIMNEVFQIKDFTSGSIKKGGLFDPNAYGSLSHMYTAPNQDYLFNIEDYLGPLKPDSKEAARIFNDLIARKSGYQSMAAFKRQVLNRWPQKDQEQLFRELWHNQDYEGYIEHLTAKGSHMNWYWDMKGLDRHAVENVRILYNDNLKNLKDTVEKIVYGSPGKPGLGWQSPNLKDRIVVSFEDPMRKTKKLYSRQNPGDIILKRASNDKIIGNLGQYLDLLYPQDPILKDIFIKGVAKLDMTPADFRKMILTERINIILNNTNTLPANPTARKRWIKQNTDDDMAALVQKYPFLSMPKAIKKQIDEDPGISTEGLDKRSETSRGPFKNVTKTEQFNPRQILMDIFGPDD